MSEAKIFNSETLLLYTENDRNLAAELASMAINDIPDFLKKTDAFLAEDRYSEASQSCHSLKGVAGAVGAELLFACSFQCEQLLKQEPLSGDLSGAVKDLHREAESLLSDPDFLKFSQ